LRLTRASTATANDTGVPVAHVAAAGPQPCQDATTAAPTQSAFTADEVASAYDFSGLYAQDDEGQGETIAVYELEPYAASDIAAYQSCYRTAAQVTPIAVDGGAGVGPGSGEAALDIEQLIAFAPKARVLAYEGPNSFSNAPGSGPYDVFSEIVSQDRAQVVTNSWGNCEADEGSGDADAENVLFEEAAVQGQTVVSAAGDDGSEDCYGYLSSGGTSASGLSVDDPASQPL
jgi:subtilase family serine protease